MFSLLHLSSTMEQNLVIKTNFCEQILLPLGCQIFNMVNSVSLGFGKDKLKHFKTAFFGSKWNTTTILKI